MAVRTKLRDTVCLSRFCKLVVICLFISSIFAKTRLGYTSYTRQELLDIGSCNSDIIISVLPEIAKPTAHPDIPTPTGGLFRRTRKRRRRGSRGGIRARLKLTPSLFVANVRLLANKMNELRLRITTQNDYGLQHQDFHRNLA